MQLQEVLQKRFEQPSNLSEQDQLKQANALYSLVSDKFKNRVRLDSPIQGFGYFLGMIVNIGSSTQFTDLY